jgi:hypothetical protein
MIYIIFILDNQLFVVSKESIPSNTHLYSNKIILPKVNMNKDIHIKEEPREIKQHDRKSI